MTSLQCLLSAIVDYAGLFPPAQLSLSEAMTVYDRAQSCPDSWMLDHFVVPASQVHELVKLLPTISQEIHSSTDWTLSVILSKHWQTELEQLHQLTETISQQNDQIRISTLEVAPIPPIEIQQLCLKLPANVNTFFEIPFEADLESYLNVLQQTGTAAKLRTGGITPDAFPDSTQLSQRILALAKAQIPFKATAGLHHPLRGYYSLTDQPDSASATMHGFLNVAILSAFAYQQAITDDEALAMLEETAIAQFQFTDTAIHWRDRVLSVSDIARSRQHFFRSFGSCSFQDPIREVLNFEF